MSTEPRAESIQNIKRLIAKRAPINIPLIEISTEELRSLRTKVLQCVRAGILGGNPQGFIHLIDAELQSRTL